MRGKRALGRELRGRDGMPMGGSEGPGVGGEGTLGIQGGSPGRVERERDPLGRRMWEGGPLGVREGRRALSKAGWGEADRHGCQGKEGREGWWLGRVPV